MGAEHHSGEDIDTALDLFVGDTVRERTQESVSVVSPGKRPHPQKARRKTPKKLRSQANQAAAESQDVTAGEQKKVKTRMGRPPGVKSGEAALKDKTSLALDRDLMDRYREKSWEERCQFGELIERALRDYAARKWGW